MTKVIGKKGSKEYVLKDVLGKGSFGKVYHSPPYAVKEMTLKVAPYLRNALSNEIKILSSLNHPNIVKLYDVVYEADYVYLVMEYCQADLSQYIKHYKINEKSAIRIFKSILTGFSKLVEKGIIHRDLKPANILVNSKNQFKLADFGFAKHVDQYDQNLLNSIVGTPLYMAPQILRRTKYTTKCDIWSIGFIFYEMVVRRPPWMGSTEANLLDDITRRPLSIPSELTEWTKEVLRRTLVISETERISWDDLFKLVLGSGSRPQSRQRSNSAAKSEKKKHSQKNLEGESEEKLQFNAEDLKCLLQLQLLMHYDRETARRIVHDKSFSLSGQMSKKVQQILGLFKEEFGVFVKKQVLSR